MLGIVVTFLLVVVALTLLVIVVVGLLGRLATLRRQIATARLRLEALDRALGRSAGTPAGTPGAEKPTAAPAPDVR